MSLVWNFSQVLGIPEPAARFFLGLMWPYLLGLAYRPLIAGRSPLMQNVYCALGGIGLIYYVFGFQIWHSLVDIITVYSVLYLLGGNKLSLVLTWIIAMGHILIGYAHCVWYHQVHPIGWTIPHSVLVLKLIGIAYDIYDGQRDQSALTAEQKERQIAEVPSFSEFLGFSYFFGTVLSGPQMNFVRYKKFVCQELFDINTTPSSLNAGIRRFCLALFIAVVYSAINRIYPLNYVLTDEFMNKSLIVKLMVMVIIGKMAVWRYLTVWIFAEGACICTGITYSAKQDGTIEWNAIHNVDFYKNELGLQLGDYVDSFNIQTNRWVSMYVFKRLKWIGNKTVSHSLALLFVSLWHGLWPGYLVCFSFEFISLTAERQLIKHIQHLGDFSKLPFPFYYFISICIYLLKHILLGYALMAFMLLTWTSCWKFMSSVYWIGHVIVLVYHFAPFLILHK